MKSISYCIAAALALLLSANAHADCLTQEQEPNDRESQANGPICSETPVDGRIRNRRDVDWFYFDTSEHGDIDISLSHGHRVDFDWHLFTETGPAILSAATAANPETGVLANAEPGRYFIRVEPWSGNGSYSFSIRFADNQQDDSDPPGCGYGPRPERPGGLTSYLTGAPEDVCVELDQPSVLLMGGGADVDDAFSTRVKPLLQGGNVVVLRTSGNDGYNDYLQNLTDAASVETLILDSRDKADSDYADWAIRSAEFVWIAGGDQSDYLKQWQDTRTQEAIQHVYDKGGVVGGTSAGTAVLGEWIYDPDGILGAISEEVVTDYCHETINISEDFLDLNPLAGVITDTHFYERDRMGRLAVFQARLPVGTRGIGVSETTSLFVSANGQAVVDGRYEVYVLREDADTRYQQISCGEPVVIEGMLRYRLLEGDQYNLKDDSSNVSPIRLDIDGRQSSFYSPSNPY